MEILIRQYKNLIKHVSTKYIRNVYDKISWETRLIGIKGARGVGKTTLMLQRIVLAFPDKSKALYATLDDIWFGAHTLLDTAELATQRGITHLFLDEVHRMPGWERQIKNIYDLYPNLNIVFTGSSMLEIDHSIADLSRRCLLYPMLGLSFREFLEFEGTKLPPLTLQEILYDHTRIAAELTKEVSIASAFKKYLRHGFYPFFNTETEQNYLSRVNNIITTVIDYDMSAIEPLEYGTLLKTKQLLAVMAAQTRSPLNIQSVTKMTGIPRNQLIKLLSLLDRAMILRLLYYNGMRNPRSLAKPQKVLMNNTSIIHALGNPDKGKIRESFIASMLATDHEIAYTKDGDLLADGRYIFEVGGSSKGFNQIKDMPDSFVASDDLEIGFGNKIPLWLFGFLY